MDMRLLRLMSMFGAPQQIQQNDSAQVLNPVPQSLDVNPTPINPNNMGLQSGQISDAPPLDPYDPMARMKQLYQPRTAVSQSYADALNQMPEDQPISRGRGLAAIAAASLIGARNPQLGLETGNIVANGPNDRAKADWQNRVKVLGLGANEEDKYNANQRLLANETVSAEAKDAAEKEKERANLVKEKQNQDKITNAEERTKIYQQKADIAKDVAKGGKIVQNQAGDFVVIYRDGSSKPVDVRGWTPADIASMKNDFAIQQIDERGAVQSGNITQRGNINFGLTQERGNQARQTKQTPGAQPIAPDKSTTVEVRDSTGKVIGTRQTNTTSDKTTILRNKAIDFLNQNKLPITEANIKHAIDTKRVQ
jgi:hypothetical protein